MTPGRKRDECEEEPPPEVDLHGLRPEAALRRLAQELHSIRHRRLPALLVITGQGFGNALGKPILRGKVELWLRGPEGRRFGVLDFVRTHRGGALLVRMRNTRSSAADRS